MKKKFRKTGKIVNVISYNKYTTTKRNSELDWVSYIDSKGVEHEHEKRLNIYWDFEDVKETTDTDIDWEQVRIDVATMAMNGILTNGELQSLAFDGRKDKNNRQIPVYVSEMAVAFADALITELKKGGEDARN